MSKVIQFLEVLGNNPPMNNMSLGEYASSVAALDANDAQRQALMDRDHSKLNDLLGGREGMRCIVWPVEPNM